MRGGIGASPALGAGSACHRSPLGSLRPANAWLALESPVKRLLFPALIALIAACSGRRVTEYVGSAMNPATPEAEGSIRLTLYSRTDTSFSGVIELGAPMSGTGRAYAWTEGSELLIVTVGAAGGDSIKWFSPLTDAGLGGRFQVFGGPHTGQSGTWRAHLVAGLPATEATLRMPKLILLPSPLALWPILALILIAVALARWIRAAPRGSAVDGVPWRAPPGRLAGIGGWLLFFVVGRAISLLIWVPQFRTSWQNYGASVGLSTAVPGLQPLIVFETAVAFLGLPLTIIGLVLLFRRSPLAPRYWVAFLAFTAFGSLFDVGAMHFIRPGLLRLVGTTAHSAAKRNASLTLALEQAGFSLLWALYWTRSLRVRATFGATALDRSTIAPALESAPIGPTLHGPQATTRRRRWKRLVLRAAGVALVIVVALLAYGLFTTRAVPYDVAKGTDIRATVAGRWTWDSDSAGCRDAHTIAFESGGKVMTIVSGEIGTPEPTTYDVLRATRSSIRGAIRGEQRLTKDGKPVVWDLVLTGPDEYRWQRTDWPSTPWSYTGKIHRCPAAPATAASAPNAR